MKKKLQISLSLTLLFYFFVGIIGSFFLHQNYTIANKFALAIAMIYSTIAILSLMIVEYIIDKLFCDDVADNK